jgi:hypothetical protein
MLPAHPHPPYVHPRTPCSFFRYASLLRPVPGGLPRACRAQGPCRHLCPLGLGRLVRPPCGSQSTVSTPCCCHSLLLQSSSALCTAAPMCHACGPCLPALPLCACPGPTASSRVGTATRRGCDTRGSPSSRPRTAPGRCCSRPPSASLRRVGGTAPCLTGGRGPRAGTLR